MEVDSTKEMKTEEVISDGVDDVSSCSSSHVPLQPCRVCMAPSSGYHFGIISCEACKSFFRRTLKLKLEYTCLSRDVSQCNLRQVKGERPPCPACRFKKCVSLGMAIDAAKKGRYSHAKRVETVRATAQYWMQKQDSGPSSGSEIGSEQSNDFTQSTTVKDTLNEGSQNTNKNMIMGIEQEGQPVFEKCGNLGHEGHENTPKSQRTNHPQLTVENREQPVLEEYGNKGHEGHENSPKSQCSNQEQVAVEYRESQSDIAGMPDTYAKVNVTTTCENNRPELGDSQNMAIDSGNSLSDEIFRFLEQNCEEHPDLDKFTEIVADAYDQQYFLPKSFLAKVPLVVHKYLEEEHCKNKKHPVLEPISTEHHMKVFRETGVDLDGRMELFKELINDSEYLVKKSTAFCMLIPGFRSMCCDDRLCLLKIAKLEQIIIGLYPVHFLEERICVLPSLKVLSIDFLSKFYNKEMIENVFQMARDIQELYLNQRENALFAALLIINPANCVTEEGKTVCKTLRVYLAKCLGRTLARRVTQDKLEGLMRSIMQIVDKIAQLSKQFNKDAENIALNKLPGTSPIMVEIFNKDPHIDAK